MALAAGQLADLRGALLEVVHERGSTLPDRLSTALLNPSAALFAAPHWPELTAEETWFSCALRLPA